MIGSVSVGVGELISDCEVVVVSEEHREVAGLEAFFRGVGDEGLSFPPECKSEK